MATKLYTVQPGETLKSIASTRLNDGSRWSELAHINNVSHPYLVTPGTLILVPDAADMAMIEIAEPINPPPAVNRSTMTLSPADLGLLAVAAAVLFLVVKK